MTSPVESRVRVEEARLDRRLPVLASSDSQPFWRLGESRDTTPPMLRVAEPSARERSSCRAALLATGATEMTATAGDEVPGGHDGGSGTRHAEGTAMQVSR